MKSLETNLSLLSFKSSSLSTESYLAISLTICELIQAISTGNVLISSAFYTKNFRHSETRNSIFRKSAEIIIETTFSFVKSP